MVNTATAQGTSFLQPTYCVIDSPLLPTWDSLLVFFNVIYVETSSSVYFLIMGIPTSSRHSNSFFPPLSCHPLLRIDLLPALRFLFYSLQGLFAHRRVCKVDSASKHPFHLLEDFLTRKVSLSPFSIKICHCLSGTLLLESSFVSMAMF